MSSTKYRYAVVEQVGKLALHTTSLVTPSTREVLIRVAYCGVCATDNAIYDGTRKKHLPYSPGHEYSGIVEEVGSGVRKFRRGDRVVGNPNFICKKCYFCKRGEYHLCSNADRPHYSNGAFADYLTIDSRYVYHIPAELSMKDAALTECLACSLHAVKHLPLHQKLVLIIGAGTMGLLTLEAIKYIQGAEIVVVAELSSSRRELAKQLGADSVLGGDISETRQVVQSISDVGADVVFECAGSLQAIECAMQCVRRGGKIILVGRTSEDALLYLSPCLVARNSLSIIGSSRYKPREFEQAIQWIAQRVIHSQEYFDEVFELAELENAFRTAREGRGVKVLVKGLV